MADSLSREYHIIKATNGKEAIEQLEKTKDIVVVISDVMMPCHEWYRTLSLYEEAR